MSDPKENQSQQAACDKMLELLGLGRPSLVEEICQQRAQQPPAWQPCQPRGGNDQSRFAVPEFD